MISRKAPDILRTRNTVTLTLALVGALIMGMAPSAYAAGETPFTSAPIPTISGTAKAGSTLTAKAGTWVPAAALTYQWFVGESLIEDAVTPKFKVPTFAGGQKITVIVTGDAEGYSTTSQWSKSTKTVPNSKFSSSASPKISGTSKVGYTLTAKVSAWKPAAEFNYQWKRNGKSIADATDSTYTLTPSDRSKKISVAIRGSRQGFGSVFRTSKSTAVITVATPISGNGDFRVGTKVAPGTYVTKASTTSCYWERVTSFNGSFDSIIANDFASGQRIVTIVDTDYGFSASRCGSWIRLEDSSTSNATTIKGTGQFAVNRHVRSGTYESVNKATGCYWATLSGFSGDFDDIIANDFNSTKGTFTVTIDDDVVGFESSRCGTWKRISD